MATKKQLALIHIKKGELEKKCGFTDNCYRDLLWRVFQVESSRDLEGDDVSELLKHLDSLEGGNKKPAPPRPPSDPEATISTQQQAVIEGIRDFLGWPKKEFHKTCLDKFKFTWPQNHKDGQKVIYLLIAVGAKRLLRAIQNLRREDLTSWEKGFIFDNDKAAEKEFKRFVEAQGKRGQRRMPKVSMTKLLEILKTRNHDYSARERS